MNEWVISVWAFDNKEEAKIEYEKFLAAWKIYGDTHYKDIYLVRSCKKERSWLLVIDAGSGPYTEQKTNDEIERIVSHYNPPDTSSENREKRNNLGQLLVNCHALFYDQKEFESTNGKIININNKELFKKK